MNAGLSFSVEHVDATAAESRRLDRFLEGRAPRGTTARACQLATSRGEILTPTFMPVGTAATVKGLMPEQVHATGARLLLGNTYHLCSRPGLEVIEACGGLHRFMRWPGPILTDSGGYQVFSLASLRALDDDGVTFRSHHDGAEMRFTPESVIEAQRTLRSDIMMPLDQCTPWPCTEAAAAEAVTRSQAWAVRSQDAFARTAPSAGVDRQALYAIVQGSIFPELRQRAAAGLTERGFQGYAIGGLSVGEGREQMLPALASVTPALPADRPRYLMGVGYPEDLLLAIALGVDQFDCVIPTRNARNAMAFTSAGRLRLRNAAHRQSLEPLDRDCHCYACTGELSAAWSQAVGIDEARARTPDGGFTRAYLRHLILANEILGHVLLTLHNLTFYQRLMARARVAILEDRYGAFVDSELDAWGE